MTITTITMTEEHLEIQASRTGNDDFPVLLEVIVPAPPTFWTRIKDAWASLRGLHTVHHLYLEPEKVRDLLQVIYE